MRERVVADGPGFSWVDVEAPTDARMDELRRLHGIGTPPHAVEGRVLRPIVRRLQALRRVVLPQRDVLVRLAAGEGPAAREPGAVRGLRNSAERMAQIGVETETLREALHDATADRQSDIVRRLTLVAAVFLPLTFLTGFFGQNFGWMVEHVDSPLAFVALGIGLPVAAVAMVLYAFHRSGWL